MAKTTLRCVAAWLLAAFVGLLFLAAGCTCARQADSNGSTTSQIQPDTTTPPPLVNPSDDLPDAMGDDQAAVSSAAGQTEEDAEASGDGEDGGEETGDEAAEGDDGSDDPAEDGGGDDTGDGGGDGSGAEDDPADTTENGGTNGDGETVEPDPQIDPVAIFRRSHCGDCHGAERKGTSRGPSLLEIDQYWNADSLVQYLKSPVYEAEGNQRLIELGRQYNLVMPPAHRDDKELKALAVWLIEQAVAE